jgi:hypothetical protein
MSKVPQVSFYDVTPDPDTGVPADVDLKSNPWDLGEIKAQENSDELNLRIWNNRGGVDSITDVQLTATLDAANDVGETKLAEGTEVVKSLPLNTTQDFVPDTLDVAIDINENIIDDGNAAISGATAGTDYVIDYTANTITFPTGTSLTVDGVATHTLDFNYEDIYVKDTDYTIDYVAGSVTPLSTGSMPDATDYLVSADVEPASAMQDCSLFVLDENGAKLQEVVTAGWVYAQCDSLGDTSLQELNDSFELPIGSSELTDNQISGLANVGDETALENFSDVTLQVQVPYGATHGPKPFKVAVRYFYT